MAAFDQFAHSVSGLLLLAGFGYAVVRLIEAEYDDIAVPPNLKIAFVQIFATSFDVPGPSSNSPPVSVRP